MWFKSKAGALGDFEQLVLLGVLRLGDEAYGAAIRQEIHARSGRDVSINAVYTTLDRLEGKGLLRRAKHPQDRRAVVIELTTQGRALVPHLQPAFGRVVGRLLAGFDDTQVAQLRGMLDRMLVNLAAHSTLREQRASAT
jgi:DNA-binding PadR family transcriptional regulator